jgi:hypothetical protein
MVDSLSRKKAMIESPVVQRWKAESLQDAILAILKNRFGPVSRDVTKLLRSIGDEKKLIRLNVLAAECTFVVAIAGRVMRTRADAPGQCGVMVALLQFFADGSEVFADLAELRLHLLDGDCLILNFFLQPARSETDGKRLNHDSDQPCQDEAGNPFLQVSAFGHHESTRRSQASR